MVDFSLIKEANSDTCSDAEETLGHYAGELSQLQENAHRVPPLTQGTVMGTEFQSCLLKMVGGGSCTTMWMYVYNTT